MTQTIVLYRLVGTVDVTFNQLAFDEVDLFQLCQGLEAFEVSCVEQECISVYMENFPGTFSCCLEATPTINDPKYCGVSTRVNG